MGDVGEDPGGDGVTGPAASESFVATLRDLVRWLDGEGLSAAVIGGVAVSTHGRPRMTRDVDLLALVNEGDWQEFFRKSSEYGFETRRGDAVDFANRTRVVLLSPSDRSRPRRHPGRPALRVRGGGTCDSG